MQQNIVWNKWNDFIFHEVSKNKISFFCILYYFIYMYFFFFWGGGEQEGRERENSDTIMTILVHSQPNGLNNSAPTSQVLHLGVPKQCLF